MTNEQVDALLSELDQIAREYDYYEFGLPLHDRGDGTPLTTLRGVILKHIWGLGSRHVQYPAQQAPELNSRKEQ